MKLSNILPSSGDGDNLTNLWEEASEAVDYAPLPPGVYDCHVVKGERISSRSRNTPGYQITFSVVDHDEYAGRRCWLDCWLTANAMPRSKRELGKIGIKSSAQLDQPLPFGIRCKVKLTVRTDDSGKKRNSVAGFEFLRIDQPTVDAFAPQPEAIAKPRYEF